MPYQPYRTIPRQYNPKLKEVSGVSIYPLSLSNNYSMIIPIIIPMGLTSYGQFISDTTYITNPGGPLTYTSSHTSGGMTLAGVNDITVGHDGDYMVITTINWQHSGGGVSHQGRQWISVNGTNVPLSSVETTINGGGTNELPLTSQWLLTNLFAGDVINVYYANTDITLVPSQSPAVTGTPIPASWQYDSPAVPAASVIVLQLST